MNYVNRHFNTRLFKKIRIALCIWCMHLHCIQIKKLNKKCEPSPACPSQDCPKNAQSLKILATFFVRIFRFYMHAETSEDLCATLLDAGLAKVTSFQSKSKLWKVKVTHKSYFNKVEVKVTPSYFYFKVTLEVIFKVIFQNGKKYHFLLG